MLPAPAPSLAEAILPRLRRETRPYHDALEAGAFNRALATGTLTQAVAEHFLRKLYGFLHPYEAALRQHPFGPEWNMADRFRAHLILADLGLPPAAAGALPPLPLCPGSEMPPLATWPQVLGALYVIEGSTLGGQVIGRQLAQAGLGLQGYFRGGGARTGPLWQQFGQALAAAAPLTDEAELVASAGRTFQQLHTWINRP